MRVAHDVERKVGDLQKRIPRFVAFASCGQQVVGDPRIPLARAALRKIARHDRVSPFRG